MSEYAWTAAEVYELVKGWPGKARAPIGYGTGGGGEWVQRDGTTLEPRHAAALHVESGLVWLMRYGEHVMGGAEVWFVRRDHARRGCWTGPTPLHATHAAIMAAKGGDDGR